MPGMSQKQEEFDPQWAKAKKVCRLNMEDIRMAKALGFSPKSLMKNNPSPTQKWKLPVREWIRELYAERFDRKKEQQRGDSRAPQALKTSIQSFADEETDPNWPF